MGEDTPGKGLGTDSSSAGHLSRSTAGNEVEATIEPVLAGVTSPEQSVQVGYTVGSLLGRGGEGEVHAAVQRAFGRTVAVKRVRGGILDLKRLRRFRAEALITALLEHPNIVPIYDLRETEAGELNLVMKKVDGVTWKELLRPRTEAQLARAKTVTLDDHLDILLKVCDAVALAHERGYLHRDLKPENVMVGDHGQVLVMDWGCAVCLGKPPHPAIATVADMEAVSGTPVYMAPEQARNDIPRVGPWTDVYLLGAILYQILCGKPPHQGATVKEALVAAAKGVVIPPAERLGKPVDEELAALAMTALEADPERRTRSVDDFADAVRACRRHGEAMQLLRQARQSLREAEKGHEGAEEAFRRSLGSCEQAIAIWPEQQDAQILLVRIAFANARYALESGGFRACRTLSQRVLVEAKALGDSKTAGEAERMAKEAVKREADSRARERAVRRLRRFAVAGSLLAAVALAVGLVLTLVSSREARQALHEAETNLSRFEEERAQRIERERLAVPALVAQARESAAGGAFAAAVEAVDAALAFDANQPEARALKARSLTVLHRWVEAREVLSTHLESTPGDEEARALLALLSRSDDEGTLQQAVADLFLKQGHSAEAEAMFTGVDQHEAAWRERMAAAWPGFDQRWFTRREDGTYALLQPPRAQFAISSLEPIRDIPLSQISLTRQPRVRDLGPLASAPLTFVEFVECGVRDVAALAGKKITKLNLSGCDVSDLTPLRGMPLADLDLSANPIRDLGPLAECPLIALAIANCSEISDLGPLRVTRLNRLICSGTDPAKAPKVVSLRPLEGLPIRYLDIRQVKTITDFTPLERIRPDHLYLDGTRIDDLSPLWSLQLVQLSITYTAVTDLAPITKQPLKTLDASFESVKGGFSAVRTMASLERINAIPAADFWKVYDIAVRLAAANKDFGWKIRPVVENGLIVELDLNRNNLVDLRPLVGLPLRKLSLWGNRLTDLRPLANMPLVDISLDGNPVSEISWVAKMPIGALSLAGTQVADLAPLAKKAIHRLAVNGAPVGDLRPVASQATLEQIVFTPNTIKAGIPQVRANKTVTRIGIAWDKIYAVADFWQRFDRGDFK